MLFWARLEKGIGASIQFISRQSLITGERRRRQSETRCDILQRAEKGIKSYRMSFQWCGLYPKCITNTNCSLCPILQRGLCHHSELVPRGKQADHLVALPPPSQLRAREGGEEEIKMALPIRALVDTFPLTKLL